MTTFVEPDLLCAALQTAVDYSMSMCLPNNAVFLSERLFAADPCEKNRRLIAKSYLQSGKPVQAKAVLENATGAESKYLFAVVCCELNQLREAEIALLPRDVSDGSKQGEGWPESSVPGGAAGFYLLGFIFQRTSREMAAKTMYRRALEFNPLLWVAIEGLAFYGEEPALAMKSDEEIVHQLVKRTQDPAVAALQDDVADSPTPAPLETPPASGSGRGNRAPSGGATDERDGYTTPAAPAPASASQRRASASTGGSSASSLTLRSARFSFRSSGLSPKMAVDVNSCADHLLKHAEASPTNGTGGEDYRPVQSCMDLLSRLGEAVTALAQYRCEDAIALFSALPSEHFNTGYVLASLGRAYMEVGDYHSAEEKFERARAVDPVRMDGLVEFYSTILWHQKKEVKLANLARQSIEIDRFSAATWCAAGNCFSLQRDPNTALKFFKRAVQVDPWSAYAHTLVGHEHVLKEDLDSAKASYREALAIDSRHYNAWYGIGHVYQKQENYEMAEQYYRAALKVHPRRATLHYHLGCALFASGSARSALKSLDRALELDPNNPVAKFERAKVLNAMKDYDAAMEELKHLCESLPREAAVHYEMGRLLKKTNDLDGAWSSFSIAFNLDPKARIYKKSLESLDYISDEQEEE